MAVVVKKKPGESGDQLISSFRRKTADIIVNVKKRARYTKPSQQKREEKKQKEREARIRR
ncbi:MAG: 30S ribosomal protein S21 [Candidatus Shapirobacteria bacterium]|nr:30S ribosomal protein S21 [Candidatus Shapirobacteria bacterium]MDD5073807.1 30S ribosomal protein S21 [Candidatus Shapirobacteria bacterium]MDD5481508.1 30S ribosomal protein S21 [Candidatus Shapirobacteria bacterium]